MSDNIFGTLIESGDRLARETERLNGVKHLYRRSPLDPLPGRPLLLALTTDGICPYDSARCFYTLDGSDPAGPSARVCLLEPGEVTWSELAWGYIRYWALYIPPQPPRTLLRYRLAARRADTEMWVFGDNQAGSLAEAQDFALWIDDDPAPAWSREALTYHVFLDRFYPGDGKAWEQPQDLKGFYGGTIRGVCDKLDYIQSLGFNTIWLSPFFPTDSHHGYNATDTYSIEPRLGSQADLHELIAAAHARGIRLIMDFVANHWSSDHPTFIDAQRNPNSHYHDWYIWQHWPDAYACYFQTKSLPQLNLERGPAREYLLDVARYWLRQGFDGYRLDYAYGPSRDFWVDFRIACREVNPECWIFGEVVHTAEVQRSYAGIMDGTLDFLLARALRETFALQNMRLSEFEAFLANHEGYFPAGFSRPAFLDNHDMSRFLYMAGDNKEKLKLAALILYTLSGPPIVYNGTESGTTQERPMLQGDRYIFEEARLPVKWDAEADAELVAYFRRLGGLRRAHPALRGGTRRLVKLDNDTGIYAYLRETPAERLLVAVNNSTCSGTIELPQNLAKAAREQLNGLQIVQRSGVSSIILPPFGGALVS